MLCVNFDDESCLHVFFCSSNMWSSIYSIGINKFIITPANYLLVDIVVISCSSDDILPSNENNWSLITHADKTIWITLSHFNASYHKLISQHRKSTSVIALTVWHMWLDKREVTMFSPHEPYCFLANNSNNEDIFY